MAIKNGNSGTYNITTGNQYISGYVEWTETYDDQTYISTNKTTVTQKVYLHRTNTYNKDYNVSSSGTRTAYFGSETVKNTDKQDLTIGPNPPGNYTCIFTASKEITHDANGSKIITLGIETDNNANIGGFEIPKTTKDITLMTIPRYANFTNHHIASVGTHSINVYWGADATCDAIQCSLNGGGWFDVGGYPEYTIGGLSPNTSYSVRTRIRRQDSQLWTESGTIYATTDQVTPNITGIWVKSVGLNSITFAFSCDWAHTFYYKLVGWSNWTRGWNNINYAEVTITGLAPNTTYTLEVLCRNWINEGANTYKDAYVTCAGTTLDIGTITSAPDINFGDSARITKSNPSGVLNNLRVETLNPTVTIASRDNIGNDYTLTLTDAEWDELYKKLGDNNSIIIRYVIDTYGDTIYYHWVDRTLTLTGNQKTAHIGVNGIKKRAKVFLGVNGSVKRAVMWIGNNGRKRCI